MTRSKPSALLEPPKLVGVQRPRVLSRPDWASSAGEEAIDLARSVGVNLDPAQEFAVMVILAEAKNGNWAAFETAVLMARQNGKGEIILVLELAALFLLGEMLVLHSAHEFKTSKEAYLRIKSVIEGAPHLSRLVKQFRQSNEDTSVELMSGARLRFMARSRQSGRGFSVQRLLIDEAQILARMAMGALIPTVSAQPNPQINYFGTVPGPHDVAEHFTDLRTRGRAGDDLYLAWLEWNIGEECTDLNDRSAWAAANPALGIRISEDFVAKERASLSDEDFARERLSIWASAANSEPWGVVSRTAWDACLSGEAERKASQPGWLVGPVALAVEMNQDRTRSTIAVAGECREGGIGVDVAADGEGMAWVVAQITALTSDPDRPVSHVVLDPRSPAGSLAPDLLEAGITVTECTTGDVVKATGTLIDLANETGIVHRNSAELTRGAAVAKLRKAGESRVIDRWGDQDAVPFIAANLAVWGHLQPVENTTSKYETDDLLQL